MTTAATGLLLTPTLFTARFELLAAELRAFDSVLAHDIREHLIASLQAWQESPSITPTRVERARRYRALVQALTSTFENDCATAAGRQQSP